MTRRYSDELYHFGVKGMKWGVRKDRGRGGIHAIRRAESESRYKSRNSGGKRKRRK